MATGVAAGAAELDELDDDELDDDELDELDDDELDELDDDELAPVPGGTGRQLADEAGGWAGSDAGADHSSTWTRTGSGSGLNTRT